MAVSLSKQIEDQEKLVSDLNLRSSWDSSKGNEYIREKLKLVKMKEKFKNNGK